MATCALRVPGTLELGACQHWNMRPNWLVLTAGALVASGCARNGGGTVAPGVGPGAETTTSNRPTLDPSSLERAERALVDGDPARAVALFGRYLSEVPEGAARRQAYLGLASAHERLRDCGAAIRAFQAFLGEYPGDGQAAQIHMRRGACEAELGLWEQSAASYRTALKVGELLASTRVEIHAREGFAWFSMDRFDEAEATLAAGEEVFETARERERFDSYYFVGMNRFYRAAILHRRFRDVRIRLPRHEMTQDYETKMKLLVGAQEAYRATIRAKHVFWVSAAGFQMGRLFGEFYDAVMYAPVPRWLNHRQRSVYYEELKSQLRPVMDKSIWVFEKNLETARKLGYDSDFVGASEEKLAHLRAVLLSEEAALGRPHPRLVPEVVGDLAPPSDRAGDAPVPVAERKLFVPLPTSL